MKNLKSIALALVVVLSTASVTAQTKKVDASASTINWVGKKVTGQHNGTVNLKDGALVFKGKKLTGGTFTVDMTSLTATDLKGEYQGKLNGHLKADDFFGTDKFPTSTLVFKTIKTTAKDTYAVTADLTIKGITKPVNFNIKVNGNTAATTFNVDRTKYDIKYGSKSFFDSLGDKAISDEFELAVSLKM
ncbi:YceI family protein [Flavobacterium acetivorans]|uniref:YceI family protein n=1 Tax=Flavobacterium acetivorans TaxID=2893883 RepID=UPI001E4620AC|nr:YceI family protein [Flavobacterium sp. F-29]UFH34219.1 YceI family protein [Flavobacterium sp. F-29]